MLPGERSVVDVLLKFALIALAAAILIAGAVIARRLDRRERRKEDGEGS